MLKWGKKATKTRVLLHESPRKSHYPWIYKFLLLKGVLHLCPKEICDVSKDLSEPRWIFFSLKFLINDKLVKNWKQILQRVKIQCCSDPNSSKKIHGLSQWNEFSQQEEPPKCVPKFYPFPKLRWEFRKRRTSSKEMGNQGKMGSSKERKSF